MGRESVRERKDRLERGGEWLRAQRQARDWTQAEFASRLQLAQSKVSAYESGRYEVDVSIARDIARVLGVTEWEVWRGLQLPLPRELDDEEAIARALELAPEVIEKVTGLKSTNASRVSRRSASRQPRDVRPGEKRRNTDHGEESAV